MPITFNCPCGKVLRIADEHAGKRIKCPACQALGTAPKAEPQFEVVDEEPKEQLTPAPAKPAAKPTAKPVAKSATRDEDDDAGFTVEEEDEKPKKKPTFSKGSRRDDDEDEEDERPRKKKRRRDDDDYDDRPRRRPAHSDTGKKILYLIGGLLLVGLGIGLAYFGLQGEGRGATKVMVFGAALAIGGFITAIKGITGNFDEE